MGAAALSLISCCCLSRITPAPSPPTRTKSPKMVAMTLLPPNFFLGWLGVITGGISKLGAAEPASGGNGGGIEVSETGISIGAGGVVGIWVGSLGGVTWEGLRLVSVGLFWSGI